MLLKLWLFITAQPTHIYPFSLHRFTFSHVRHSGSSEAVRHESMKFSSLTDRKHQHQHNMPTVRWGGGSVTLWGGCSAALRLVTVEWEMNAAKSWILEDQTSVQNLLLDMTRAVHVWSSQPGRDWSVYQGTTGEGEAWWRPKSLDSVLWLEPEVDLPNTHLTGLDFLFSYFFIFSL